MNSDAPDEGSADCIDTSADAVTDAVGHWLERFVIAENLCPFAGRAWRNGAVRIVVEAGDTEASLERLAKEIAVLLEPAAPIGRTTLIALVDERFADFDIYLDLVELGDRLIDALGQRGDVQLASFHPQYRFEGAPSEDPANWSNRSPWPLLHLLSEDSLEQALEQHADPDGIPTRNIEHLRTLGLEEVRRRARR